MALIEIRNLTKVFALSESGLGARPHDEVRAVDDVTLDIEYGETLGPIGESGCAIGKTALKVFTGEATHRCERNSRLFCSLEELAGRAEEGQAQR